MVQTVTEIQENIERKGLEIASLPPEQLDVYWPQIDRTLDKIPHTWAPWWTKEYLYAGVMNGAIQLWAVGNKERWRMVFITQIIDYPAARVLHVMNAFGSGDVDEAVVLADAVFEKFALSTGCERIEGDLREGWKPKVEALGYRRGTVKYSRPVTGGLH